MRKKILVQSCWTCRYRERKACKEPCNICAGTTSKSGWRKRSWWQSPVMAYILAALIAVALLAAMLIEWSTARAAGPEEELLARQEEVHAAADLLRELGVAEDSEGIRALQEEWWRCQARIYPRYTENEVVMLAKLMWGEAGGIESVTEVACVGWVVCNRVDDQPEPVTVASVITLPNRFCYSDSFPVRDDLYALARDVLERWTMESLGYKRAGRVLPADYRWYAGDGKHNYFRNAYKGGDRWGYEPPSPYES